MHWLFYSNSLRIHMCIWLDIFTILILNGILWIHLGPIEETILNFSLGEFANIFVSGNSETSWWSLLWWWTKKRWQVKDCNQVNLTVSGTTKHQRRISEHYLICCKHSTAEAKQASFVFDDTCITMRRCNCTGWKTPLCSRKAEHHTTSA